MSFPTPTRATLGVLVSTFAVTVPAVEPAPAAGGANAAAPAVLRLVNRERARHGLRPLRGDRRLAGVARRHARDLVRYRFFGHTSPRRGSLRRRVARSGFTRGRRRWTAGENLAMGRGRAASARRVVRAWMTSPGHRANILGRAFTSAGLGVARGLPTGARRGRTVVMTFGG
jgi:uncharacterized protein YkwD